jgi:hypothetical protein
MRAKLIDLRSWCDGMSGSPKQKKEEAAFILQVGVATIYRWIKEGGVFIEECAALSDDYGYTYVWHMKKAIEA